MTTESHAHATHSTSHDGAHKPARRHSNGRHSHRMASAMALDNLTASATRAAESAVDQLAEFKKAGVQTARTLEKRVVKHPKSSLLIAFGIGYVWARMRKWL